MDHLEAFVRDGLGVLGRKPDANRHNISSENSRKEGFERNYGQNDGVVSKSNVVVEDHLLPDNGNLASVSHSIVRHSNKSAQALLECLACCTELRLGLSIVIIAFLVDFVATCGEVLGWESGEDILEEISDECVDLG